ncbi:hypothetical protein D9753_33970 [Streptomyces dangxiongensis]|uniref:Uncharacterized protein n=1 Tax=Streptomyces dangxiongensis TaxID=1442032 RepID=A0A3G2JNR2_9ACTN|nr:hypothetical protein [Streptomyces dangxiongensis]AYN43065.1 hypothetical protein D9753_33970 [Streptomyces dangxiongensis]
MTAEWYVLVEEDTRTTERVDGTSLRLHRWMLAAAHPVDGDEARAVAAAEDAALHYLPDMLARHARPGDEPARHALLTRDGAWIVLLRQRRRECHIRVTTARLMHTTEEKEAPPKSLKDKFRSALDGPPPPREQWEPT